MQSFDAARLMRAATASPIMTDVKMGVRPAIERHDGSIRHSEARPAPPMPDVYLTQQFV